MKLLSVFFLVTLLMAHSAFAARGGSSRSYSSSSGSDVSVPVSGSIVMPGVTTATFTNPAGLVNDRGLRLSLQSGSPKPMDDPNYRALLLAGNDFFGASAGVDYFMPNGSSSDSGWAVYGLAVKISAIDFSIGVSGRSGIKTATGNDFNAGFLFKPTQFVSVGGTAMNLNNQPDNYGLGIGFNLMSGVELVADAGFDDKFKNGEFKPGLKIANTFAGLSVSYGTGATAQFSKDFSGAAYLRVGTNSELEFQYNHGGQIPKYYASLSFGF